MSVAKSRLGEEDPEDRNIILWLDHRALEETDAINATGHNLLRYVGGTMNVEMEMPKVLWLKNHMAADVFARCKFYDLADALTHLATGSETRSFCSTVCKQGYVPVGVDGSVKGWQEDFYRAIGLGELADENYKRVGGVNGVVSPIVFSPLVIYICSFHANTARTASISLPASWWARFPSRPPASWACRPALPLAAA